MRQTKILDDLIVKLEKRLNHLNDGKVHIKEFVRTAKSAEVRKVLEWMREAKRETIKNTNNETI
jgi:hypothetical protein